MAFFTELEQKLLKFVWKHKKLQSNLEKEQKLEVSCSLISKYAGNLQYGPGIKTDTDQWNRIESPEINPHLYGQLFYDKGGKNIQWGKESLFSKQC